MPRKSSRKVSLALSLPPLARTQVADPILLSFLARERTTNLSLPEIAHTPLPRSHPLTHALFAFLDRTQRVKAARSEAQKETEEYRASKDAAFKEFEKEVSTAISLLSPELGTNFSLTPT